MRAKKKGADTHCKCRRPFFSGQKQLRTSGRAGAFVDLYVTQIRKLRCLVAEDGPLDPVNVVAEVKVNTGSGTDRGKCASGAQAVAVEAVDDVIAAIKNVRAMNLELHSCVRARVIAVAEAHIDYR